MELERMITLIIFTATKTHEILGSPLDVLQVSSAFTAKNIERRNYTVTVCDSRSEN